MKIVTAYYTHDLGSPTREPIAFPVHDAVRLENRSKLFSWDNILEKVGEVVLQKIGGVALSEVFGPNKWKAQVSNDLSTIILKLDEILDEIRKHRDFIRENAVAKMRSDYY